MGEQAQVGSIRDAWRSMTQRPVSFREICTSLPTMDFCRSRCRNLPLYLRSAHIPGIPLQMLFHTDRNVGNLWNILNKL